MNFAKNTALLIILIIMIYIILFTGYFKTENATRINLSDKTADFDVKPNTSSIRIAVSPIISPGETLVYYGDLLDYISDKLGVPVELVQRKTYQEVNDLIRRNDVDAAFVCSLAYIEGHDRFGMELLAVPVVRGKTYYNSYIIVPNSSNINSLKELKGKTFAFTDPLSNSGKLSPEYMLVEMGDDPETFFKMVFYTYSHDKSIQSVAEKMVDGAAVDSLVWEFENRTNPGLTSKTRIINISPPYGIPPVVVSKDLDPALEDKLRLILLHMHENKRGRKILENLMIDRFSEAHDSLYNSIRDMKKSVAINAERQTK